MSRTAITSPDLAPPAGPVSQALEVGGFLFVSGQVGQDPATGKIVDGGIVGRNFDHVARAGVYLTNMNDFGAMNEIYAKHFSRPFPAHTTIAVAALPLGARIKMDLVVRA
jgi:2-iminobutanoate/2-iminopropanoate deaminase